MHVNEVTFVMHDMLIALKRFFFDLNFSVLQTQPKHNTIWLILMLFVGQALKGRPLR